MNPETIESIRAIQYILRAQKTDSEFWLSYGLVKASYEDGLVLFCYRKDTPYVGTWNWFERNSRGLIFNETTGELIARPFPKFFNFAQDNQHFPQVGSHMIEITQKVDGSLNILYPHPTYPHGWKLATKGAFGSIEANLGTHLLHQRYTIPTDADEWTYLFELIHPESRIIIDYGDRQALVLLAARNIETGFYKNIDQLNEVASICGFDRPVVYNVDQITDIQILIDKATHELGADNEGWVVRYDNDDFFKVKSAAYMKASYVESILTLKIVAEMIRDNRLIEFIENIPDEFIGKVKDFQESIETAIQQKQDLCQKIMDDIHEDDQKQFALAIAHYPNDQRNIIFSLKKGQNVRKELIKQVINGVIKVE